MAFGPPEVKQPTLVLLESVPTMIQLAKQPHPVEHDGPPRWGLRKVFVHTQGGARSSLALGWLADGPLARLMGWLADGPLARLMGWLADGPLSRVK
jgi:hypothetical protein